MLGTMVLDGVWVEVLGEVHDMLVCGAEAESAAEVVRTGGRECGRGSSGSISRFSVFRGFVDMVRPY